MAVARQSFPLISPELLKTTRNAKIAAAAAVLATVCGLLAFVVLILKDRGHPRIMVNELAAPKPQAAAPPVLPPNNAVPDKPAAPEPVPAGKSSFEMSNVGDLVPIGSVKARLLSTDASRKTYDLAVLSGHRSYTYHRLKADQTLWLSAGRKKGSLELVVTAVRDNSVAGYWSESSRSARLSARNKNKHR
jgi:hypothetical protein